MAPADVVAIEVINRLCAPVSEFALAEHWYASTALEDLQGVANVHLHPIDGLSAHDVVTHLKALGRFEPMLKQWLADAGVTAAAAPAHTSAGETDAALA